MKKFIAYFDILGYGERIKDKNIDEEHVIQKDLRDDIREIIEKNANERIKFNTIPFSDTHIFYTDDVSEDAFEIIIKSSLIFMLLAAVRKHPYLPLRGVIHYGDFMADYANSIFIGKGLRESYIFEKDQEWAGCFVSDLCYEQVKNFKIFKEFQEKLVLVKYYVPFKKSMQKGRSYISEFFRRIVLNTGSRRQEIPQEAQYVINMEAFSRVWGEECKDMPITNPEFIENIFVNKGKESRNLLSLNESAKKKMKNTKDFFTYIRNLVEKQKA